jgi:hypothetical protein
MSIPAIFNAKKDDEFKIDCLKLRPAPDIKPCQQAFAQFIPISLLALKITVTNWLPLSLAKLKLHDLNWQSVKI